MNNLKNKLKKNGGFTLIEMLIVVAIIAILIAVSIPLVNGALEKSREATDAANERSFKAALTTAYLMDEVSVAADGTVTAFDVTKVYVYDAVNGALETASTNIKPYGQGTTAGQHKGTDGTHANKRLWGCVDANTGKVKMQWSDSNVTATTAFTADTDKTLTSLVIVDTTVAAAGG